MAYDIGLAQRIREALEDRPGLSERAMFGGLAFLVDGKMFVGVQDVGPVVCRPRGVPAGQEAKETQ